MKNIFFCLVATSIIIAGIILTACSSEDGKINNEEQTDNIELKTEEFDEGLLAELLTFKEYDFSDPSKLNIGIVEFDIKSPSRDCEKGWGFCNVVWFRTIKDFIAWLNELSDKGSSLLRIPVLHDESTGGLYMEILLNAPVPRGISIADHPFKVEKDIFITKFTAQAISSAFEKELVLKSGIYSFDECLGEFGGFRIDLLQN